MACELSERLKFLTEYKVSIDESFTALGNGLFKNKAVTIKTPIPPFRIDYNGEVDQFPSSITVFDNSFTDIPVNSLNESLLLKLPNDEYRELNVVASTNKYRKGELAVSVKNGTNDLPQGKEYRSTM